MTARWRLQLLAELGVGRLSRRADLEEEAELARFEKAVRGGQDL